jgi:hypothetical protein
VWYTVTRENKRVTHQDNWSWGELILDPMWLRTVERDGTRVLLGRCPGCGSWGELDEDQASARVSTDCPQCPFHETMNWLQDHAV